jgi:ATP synthase F1 epsilon subunit
MTLKISVMTPDSIVWDAEAQEIILPTNTGQMGILDNHIPLITALDIGVMLIREKNDWVTMALMGGFALIQKNQITILVNEAEQEQTMQADKIEEEFFAAKKAFEEAEGRKQKIETNLVFKRARARYQVIQKV